MKVFSGDLMVNGIQMNACIAAKSQKQVCEIIGISMYELNKRWSITQNEDATKAALSDLGVVFVSSKNRGSKYFPITTFSNAS